jgi:hypothetical protein
VRYGLNGKPWRQALKPLTSKTRARPAALAARIRRTGRASPPKTMRRSISFRKNSSTKGCRECAVTANAVRRCQARSAWRPPAQSMPCGPKFAGPACPAMSNVRWRDGGMGCRRSRDFSSRRGDDLSTSRPGETPGPICGRPPCHKSFFDGLIGSLASICPAC